MTPRVAFAGTPDFARKVLETLCEGGMTPELVLTQPPRPTGRGKRLTPSVVVAWAEQAGLSLATPASLRDPDIQAALRAADLDVLVVAAYGLILPRAVLEAPRFGCLNVHASLLPRWRGAAPVERAILAGDRNTGVCIMQMDEGLDTGPVVAHESVPIGGRTTAAELTGCLADIGARLLLDCLRALDSLVPIPQDGEPTYAHKITAEDSCIDWRKSADAIDRQVRALGGRQAAWTSIDGVRVRIVDAEPVPVLASVPPGTILTTDHRAIAIQCGERALVVTRLALDRGKGSVLGAADAVNGYGTLFRPGRRFDVGE
jgi:methionyl-tRNA formyltransferase